MNGFEVPVEVLREAGRAGAPVADGLAVLPLEEAVAAVGTALPGGAAGAAAATLAVAWGARLTAATDAVARQAGALQIAADGYHAAERRAVASLVGEQ
ncbi:hypothetical protein [Pseudonocardia charpentierae]|uniref:Excreted virulence factor EspC, type VII ESX diderm n=1 Tax=Pseudonocardia charpentierae TaxID=3075545 RepID=A0ABU2N783_9PSEU|nr:hypothetical protein [Pseudonocardia sp. DSM 45834]MDT0349805.1 hypothetical protein [Pseudonocardia sp. DSM 45834]